MMRAQTVRTAGVVASSDALATAAGVQMLGNAGSAADAAVATAAVLAVTAPYACGLGGDLIALVNTPQLGRPRALLANGASGSGADADALRAEGYTTMPYQNDVRSTTAPGCVDGWLALHTEYGRLPLATVLEPAATLAIDGFPMSDVLAHTLSELDGFPAPAELVNVPRHAGVTLRRAGLGRTLKAIAASGRSAFYEGEFAAGLVELSDSFYTAADLVATHAAWVEPLGVRAWGHQLWSTPAPTQGYITLLAASICDQLGLPRNPDHPEWIHLVVEAVVAAGWDRPNVLHESADTAQLLAMDSVRARVDLISRTHRSDIGLRTMIGETTYLCATDEAGMAISLIQSNAAGYGSHIFEPRTGIHLQNRGIGFSLEPGHPAEFGSGRRPPHTLCPALATDLDGNTRVVLGSAGGDAQPQVVLQLLARMLLCGASPGEALSAPRFRLGALAGTGFDTWSRPDGTGVLLEEGAPQAWVDGLKQRGHQVDLLPIAQAYAGQGHLIEVETDFATGACEPRVSHSAVAGV